MTISSGEHRRYQAFVPFSFSSHLYVLALDRGNSPWGKKATQGNLFLAVVPRDSKGPQSKRPGCPVIQ